MVNDQAITVRPAQRLDVPALYRMLREAAISQGGEHDLCATPDNLLEDGFTATTPRFECLLAESGGQPAGLVLYYWTYSSWTSRRGVARCLLTGLAKIALSAGCRHVRWLVLAENSPAIRFYESIGAELNQGWSSMQITGKSLAQLAEE